MPRTSLHKHFTSTSQALHKGAKCEVKTSHDNFTVVHSVPVQVQKPLHKALHTTSQPLHGTLVRVMNSSPVGGFITACTREGLSGLDLAKAGQMVAILDRIESAGVEVQAARDALRSAMYGEHNPKDVLAELLTVADACRGIKTFSGGPLARIARREFPDASEVA